MRPAKRVAINTGILYGRMAITVFISLYVTRLILAALGAEDFGIFNVVGGAVAMLTFLNTAMAAATQRFMSYAQGEGDSQKQKHIFNASIILHFFIAVVLILILEGVGYFLFNGILNIPTHRISSAKIIYQFILASTFIYVISVPYDAVINAHENMLLVAILGIIESVIKLAIALYITYTSADKLISYGLLMSLLAIALLILRRAYCHRKYDEVTINFKKYFNKPIFWSMTNFAGWSLLSSAASIVTMQGISVILNSFFGVVINAAQGVSNQVSGQLLAFSNTMLKALNPVIVKKEGENDRKKMLKASLTGNKLSFYLLAFVSVPALLEMPFILKMWLKTVPDFTIEFCRLSILRMLLSQLTVTFPTALGAIGNIKKLSFFDSLIWISLLPTSYLMFKMGASPPAIYINLIVMIFALSISRVYFIIRLGGLQIKDFLLNVVSRCLIVLLITIGISYSPKIILSEGIIRLLLIGILSSSSFLGFGFMIGLTNDEKMLFLNMLKNVLKRIGFNYQKQTVRKLQNSYKGFSDKL